jgi:hypothetical protein
MTGHLTGTDHATWMAPRIFDERTYAPAAQSGGS